MSDFKTLNQQQNQSGDDFDLAVRRLRLEGYNVVGGGANPDGTKFVMLDKPDPVVVDDRRSNLIREVEVDKSENIIREIDPSIVIMRGAFSETAKLPPRSS